MSKAPGTEQDTLRPEYDFSGGVRGRYADRYGEGSCTVTLDPDVAHWFPDSDSVNRALRALIEVATRQPRPPRKRA
jgi:hypothetical protein